MGKFQWREVDEYERAGSQKIKRRTKFIDEDGTDLSPKKPQRRDKRK